MQSSFTDLEKIGGKGDRTTFCVDTLKGECRGSFLIKGDFKYLGIYTMAPDFQYVNKNMAPPGHRPLCLTTMPSGSEVLFIGTGQESDRNGCNGSVKVTSSPLCTITSEGHNETSGEERPVPVMLITPL
ncbi:unnamed protein product [Lepeophtheirus salmonis]|uniref:(salmon louse) hypothetical protein n=1 Tax=Lepeophtheirus salmonis TaxID=72036 RepID=A0A7R8CKT6_LEPSM|nr:unnamed protein product [Lepeophtheirus salmonis]CAF2851712.1 unnamed protein product [Lepeophtheirus salmonis]